MAIEITHVRYGSTVRTNEAIIQYRWQSAQNGKTGDNDKPSMVDWLENEGGQAYVDQGGTRSTVGVVRPSQGEPYLRTHADGYWNNNLLALPTF